MLWYFILNRRSRVRQGTTIRKNRLAVTCLLGSLITLDGAAFADSGDVHTIWQPVYITQSNQKLYTAILPTGRKISPVGSINGTPNFPTIVTAMGDRLAVLANGDTPFQTITLYKLNTLQRINRLAAFSDMATDKSVTRAILGGGVALNPLHTGAAGVSNGVNEDPAQKIAQADATLAAESNPKTIPTSLLSHSDLFQGLTAGADDTFYATGGATDNVITLRRVDGKVQVIHQFSLHWQSFPKDQYPYQYQGNHQKNIYFILSP